MSPGALSAGSVCGDLLGPREPLEQDRERLVVLAGRAGEGDLAGAVAGEPGVEVAASELFDLRTGGRLGQLGAGDAAVAGEGAAGGGGGDVDLVGELSGDRAKEAG